MNIGRVKLATTDVNPAVSEDTEKKIFCFFIAVFEEIAMKRRASYSSSIQEPDIDFHKFADKLVRSRNHEIRRNTKTKINKKKQFSDKVRDYDNELAEKLINF